MHVEKCLTAREKVTCFFENRQNSRLGKDKAIFVTKEDASSSSAINNLIEDESYGLIASDGSINWDCPCLGNNNREYRHYCEYLGGMANGPCGEAFKEAFSCFHYSTEEMKGQDCIPQFREMQVYMIVVFVSLLD